MTLDEFRRHPAYDYYIITLVSDCLVCDLETKFDNQYTIIYMKRPNFENKRKDYIISVPCDIGDESEEYIQSLLTYDNYKDLEYIRSVKVLYLKNLMVLFMIYMLLVKSLLVLIVLIPKFGKRIIKVLLGMVGYLNIKIIFLQVVILIDVALDGLT